MAGIMSHAVLCNNGLGQLMETGEYYESPREARPRCVFKVIKPSYDMTIVELRSRSGEGQVKVR